MNHVRKMVVVPFESEQIEVKKVEEKPVEIQPKQEDVTKQPSKKNFIKERAAQRLSNILKVIAKLALVNGYNDNGCIQGMDGSYITNSDITELITYAMSTGKVIRGEFEFIQLLKKANVSPDLIINENIKQKLKTLPSTKFVAKSEPVIRHNESMKEVPIEKPPQAMKRKRDVEEDEYQPKRSRDNGWTFSDDEE